MSEKPGLTIICGRKVKDPEKLVGTKECGGTYIKVSGENKGTYMQCTKCNIRVKLEDYVRVGDEYRHKKDIEEGKYD